MATKSAATPEPVVLTPKPAETVTFDPKGEEVTTPKPPPAPTPEPPTMVEPERVHVTVGRIVHYQLPSGVTRPAIVLHVWSDSCVDLTVFTDQYDDEPGPLWTLTSRLYGENYPPGQEGAVPVYPQNTWHWPERS